MSFHLAEPNTEEDVEIVQMGLLEGVNDLSKRKQSIIEEMEDTGPIDIGDGALMCDIDNNCGEGRRYMFFGQVNTVQDSSEPRKVRSSHAR